MPNLPQTKDMLIIVYIFPNACGGGNVMIAIVSYACYLTAGILNHVCLVKHNDIIV